MPDLNEAIEKTYHDLHDLEATEQDARQLHLQVSPLGPTATASAS